MSFDCDNNAGTQVRSPLVEVFLPPSSMHLRMFDANHVLEAGQWGKEIVCPHWSRLLHTIFKEGRGPRWSLWPKCCCRGEGRRRRVVEVHQEVRHCRQLRHRVWVHIHPPLPRKQVRGKIFCGGHKNNIKRENNKLRNPLFDRETCDLAKKSWWSRR